MWGLPSKNEHQVCFPCQLKCKKMKEGMEKHADDRVKTSWKETKRCSEVKIKQLIEREEKAN